VISKVFKSDVEISSLKVFVALKKIFELHVFVAEE
jgi:hypothetical protein